MGGSQLVDIVLLFFSEAQDVISFMMFAHEAYDILGFTEEEKYNVYKLTAIVMHMGNMTKDFVPVGKEEQAEIKNETNAQKVAELCGIDCEWMVTYYCKPKIKVGTE